MDAEVWAKVPEFSGVIMASNKGRIYSNISNCILKQYDNGFGYLQVKFRINGIRYSRYVHRLVASAFYPNEDDLEIDHIDMNKHNNYLENLEWVSHKENVSRYSAAYRKNNGIKIYLCECGRLKSCKYAELCFSCWSKKKRSMSSIPSEDELKKCLKDNRGNFTKVGSIYGVTDNAVRKWCRSFGMPTTSVAFKQ